MTSAKLYSVEQIRDIEHHAINELQITAAELMQPATDVAASEGVHGMLATDLMPIIRRLLNRL